MGALTDPQKLTPGAPREPDQDVDSTDSLKAEQD